MDKEVIDKESTYVLRNLISIHSMLNSTPGLDVKNSIKNAIIETAYWFYNDVGEKEFEKHIVSNSYVYCWTKDKIENLKKLNDIILCTSKSESAFNQNCEILSNKGYRYQYKLHIKENSFGLDLNSFNYQIHKKYLSGYAYCGTIRSNEEEVLVPLKSVDYYELIKYNNRY